MQRSGSNLGLKQVWWARVRELITFSILRALRVLRGSSFVAEFEPRSARRTRRRNETSTLFRVIGCPFSFSCVPETRLLNTVYACTLAVRGIAEIVVRSRRSGLANRSKTTGSARPRLGLSSCSTRDYIRTPLPGHCQFPILWLEKAQLQKAEAGTTLHLLVSCLSPLPGLT